LKPEEEEEFARLIKSVKNIIDKLLEADVEDVQPLYHPLEVEGYARSDSVKEDSNVDRDIMLSNAARRENGYVVAPRTVEE